jgi:acetaldehyde dehydrogenase/alcohol dehydrogenase
MATESHLQVLADGFFRQILERQLATEPVCLELSDQVGRLIQETLRSVDAPPDLVQWLGIGSTRQTTTALMSHRDVAFVLATGGPAMVEAAYRCGNLKAQRG